jgi:hypothetical protein
MLYDFGHEMESYVCAVLCFASFVNNGYLLSSVVVNDEVLKGRCECDQGGWDFDVANSS